MSPEQASGGSVDARSDVFSFGLLLYEMVTGRRPFGGGSSAEMLAALLREQPKPPSELVPDVPKELERIILRCLRKEPGRRFQHMADVKVELQEVKEESDSQASAPAGCAATAKRRSRRRWIARVAAGAPGPGRGRGPDAVAPAAARASAADGRPAHVGAARRRAAASRPTARRSRSARRVRRGQPGHLAEDRRGGRGPASHDRPRGRTAPRLVSGREADRVPAQRDVPGSQPGLRRPRPSTSCRRSAARHAGCPTFPRGVELSWSPDGRWLAAAKAPRRGPSRGGIHLISAASGDDARGDVPEATGRRRRPGLLAGRPDARLRLL